MTKTALKKKVIDYINHAEENVLEVVYKMLKVYEDDDKNSLMTQAQKNEINRRSSLFRDGKLSTTSWANVKKSVKKHKQ
jgi:hypothetical protein